MKLTRKYPNYDCRFEIAGDQQRWYPFGISESWYTVRIVKSLLKIHLR